MKHPGSLESSDPSYLPSMQHMRAWKEGSSHIEPTGSVWGVRFLIIGLYQSNCQILKGTHCLSPFGNFAACVCTCYSCSVFLFTGGGSMGVQGAIALVQPLLDRLGLRGGEKERRKKKRKEGKEQGQEMGGGRKKGEQGRKREKKRGKGRRL